MSDDQELPSMEPTDSGGATPPPPPGPPGYEPIETEAPQSRSRGRLVALWVGVAALLGASLFAVANLASSDGPSSPEAAVNKLFEAASNEDIVGALEALAPSERDVMKDDILGILDELSRLDILAKDFDPTNISGVDLEITELELTTKSLGEGVSSVHVGGGKIVGKATPSELPIGSFVKDFMDEDLPNKEETETSEIGDADTDPIDLVTIKEDGSWYVSIWYSVAEAARTDSDLPVPKFGEGVEAKGESSPEKAVRALFDAGAELDLTRAIALLPPDEARALHDYAPLFLDDAEEGAESAREEFDIKIEELELSTEQNGDVATVSLDTFDISVSGPDGDMSFAFDGKCTTMNVDGDEQEFCAEDIQEQMGIPSIPGFFGNSMGVSRLVTVKRGGEWFISPTRSILSPLHEGLSKTKPSDLDDLRDFIEGMMNGSMFGMSESFEASSSLAEVGEPIEGDSTGEGESLDNGERCSPFTSDGKIAGYTEEEFSQLSPEEQDAALEEAFQACNQ